VASPARPSWRWRWSALHLRPPRRCCTWSRCTATCAGASRATTRSTTSPAPCTCSSAAWSGPTRRRASTGTPCGVFAWRPAARVVEELSAVLDGERGMTLVEADPFACRPAWCSRRRARCATSTPPACSTRPMSTWRCGSARWPARQDADVALAAALAVRGPAPRPRLRGRGDRARHDGDGGGGRRRLGAALARGAARGVERLAASPLVAVGDDDEDAIRPLRLVGTALYLDRYWREERRVATRPARVSGRRHPPAASMTTCCPRPRAAVRYTADDRQMLAAATAVLRRLTVVAGGPGTGKTTTVARIAALLAEAGAGRADRTGRPDRQGGHASRRRRSTSRRLELDVSPEIRERLLG